MGIETEIKILLDSTETKKRILEYVKKECNYIGTYAQMDVYFAHPCRNFQATDEAFRIRVTGKKSFLTYKGPRQNFLSKKREEIEVEVDDFDKIVKLFSKLGFKEFIKIRKTRSEYDCGNLRFFFDNVDDLGEYLEIEAKNAIGEEELNEIIKVLDIEKKIIRETYLELLLSKKN